MFTEILLVSLTTLTYLLELEMNEVTQQTDCCSTAPVHELKYLFVGKMY